MVDLKKGFGTCNLHDLPHLDLHECPGWTPLVIPQEVLNSPDPELHRLCKCGHNAINHSRVKYGRFCAVRDDGKHQCRCTRFTGTEYLFEYETAKSRKVVNELKREFRS